MDYEKRYKEALSRAATELENCGADKSLRNMIYAIFPDELKESEDEEIRKALLEMVHDTTGDELWIDYDVHKEDALNWLEKQDNTDLEFFENSENEKREFVGYGFLKCKGDFLSFKEGENYWLEYVGNDNYNVRSDNLLGQTFHITPQQLYTVFRPTTWLEKQCQTFTKKDVDDAYLKGICDAKHELKQQDEYELVAKKADDEIEITFGAKDSELQEETYYIPKGFHAEIDDDKVVIKKGEKSATWSDEDERMIETIIRHLESQKNYQTNTTNIEQCQDWLKSLKPQKLEWSEKDKKLLNDAISLADECDDIELRDWLKSLKDRVSWKPSKKQMETLEYYMHTLLATEHKEVLFGLYKDLKKL